MFSLALSLAATTALSHIALSQPPSNSTNQKVGPCGAPAGGARTGFDAGQTITVVWDETINHPGHFRLAFDDDGHDLFRDPTGFTDVSGGPGVLLDGIPDGVAGVTHYEVAVTLPNVACERCTLQLIQVMTDKGPVWGDNDIYYLCADVRLVMPSGTDAGTDAGSDAGADAGASDAGPGDAGSADGGSGDGGSSPDGGTAPGGAGGCGCSAGSSSALGLLGAAVLLGRRRLRR